jgi:hypothetical protein
MILIEHELSARPELQITSWYINPHRILELIGPLGPTAHFEERLAGSTNEAFAKQKLLAETSLLVVRWLRQTKVAPLETLVVQGKIKRESVFTYDGRFHSKGLAGSKRLKDNLVRLRLALKELGDDDRELSLEFHSDGLTTSTARSRLLGAASVFTLAYVESADAKSVTARPYVIGDLVEHFGGSDGIELRYRDMTQLDPGDFDQFKGVDFAARVSKPRLEKLKSVPEKVVKATFAILVGESFVPKNWGGEQYDLFTGNTLVNGRNTPAPAPSRDPASLSRWKFPIAARRQIRSCDFMMPRQKSQFSSIVTSCFHQFAK